MGSVTIERIELLDLVRPWCFLIEEEGIPAIRWEGRKRPIKSQFGLKEIITSKVMTAVTILGSRGGIKVIVIVPVAPVLCPGIGSVGVMGIVVVLVESSSCHNFIFIVLHGH